MEHLTTLRTILSCKDNLIPVMEWESSIGASISLSIDQLRFTLALLLSLPIGLGIKLVPSPTLRHLYALLTGLLLTYYPFGFGVIHAVIPATCTYLAMLLTPKHCGLLAWAINFPYLIYLHVDNASGESWQHGDLDFTGCQMVVVLKLVSLAICYQDGRKRKKEELSPYQADHAVCYIPTPLEYASFLFSLGNLLAGPYMEFRVYKEFIDMEGLWSPKAVQKPPSALLPGLYCFVEAVLFAALYMGFSPIWSKDVLFSEWYTSHGFVVRLLTMFMVTLTLKLKFAFAWKLSESTLTLAGLNFNGFSDSGKPMWGRFENVRFGSMLLSDNARLCVAHWNIGTGVWLRRYVYERVTPKGKKPGFPQLVFTQLVSAVWHGLYPGYLLFFASTALWINFSTTLFKAELAVLPAAVASSVPMRAIKILWTLLTLNYMATSFQVLDFKKSVAVYATVYYVPHIIMLVGGFVLPLMTRKRKQRSGSNAAGGEGRQPRQLPSESSLESKKVE